MNISPFTVNNDSLAASKLHFFETIVKVADCALADCIFISVLAVAADVFTGCRNFKKIGLLKSVTQIALACSSDKVMDFTLGALAGML